MDVPFELQIALRYLIAKRKQAFISVISFISILGVTVGVMALVIALALMTGLQGEIRDRIVGSNPHIYVWKTDGIADYHLEAEKLRQQPHVLGAAPAILGQGLASASRETSHIQVKGIDPAMEPQVTDIARAMRTGSLEGLAPASADDGLGGIVLGQDLAFGFTTLEVAERLFDKNTPDYIQLRVDDIYAAPAIAKSITKALGDRYLTRDWAEMNGTLFSALSLEKIAISLTIGLIVMVAALNIVASLILLVMEKNRDIAILKTMGAGAKSVTAIFMMQGLIIGAIGTSVGATAGYALAYLLDRYKLIKVPQDVYQVSYVPFNVLPRELVFVVAGAILVCFVATIYPSRQAARLDPAQALRYE